MSANITVYLETGTYRLRRPLNLGPKDSGTNGYQVVWSAAPGANAVISGARRVRGWKLNDHSKNIWAAPVPKSLRTRQIYVDGMRASMAAGPVPVKLTATPTGYTASSAAMSHWRNPGEIQFVYTGGRPIWNVKTHGSGPWTEPSCPVASIQGLDITMAEPCWNNSNDRVVEANLGRTATLDGTAKLMDNEQPSYVENAYGLLDKPGEFYLDYNAHMLYYIPRAGQDMHSAKVEAPVLQRLVVGKGTPTAPVHDVVFSNIQFAFATWMQPSSPEGFSEIQANYTITGKDGYATEGLCQYAPGGTCPYGAWTKEPGNLEFSYDQNLSFLDDRFVHLGAAGLDLGDGSQNDSVSGSVFTDISGNGIEIGGVDMPNAMGPDQTRNIQVLDNHVYGLPVEFHGGVGILVGYAADSTISHNQIDHTSYTAISIGWAGWPDRVGQPPLPNFSHGNVVSDNLIHDDMQVLSDGGGIYNQGPTGSSLEDGEQVTGNVVHSQLDWGYALYSDNGAGFITYGQNVLYDNNYDWGIAHPNTTTNDGTYDPLLIENNYWQQGDPDSSAGNVTESGNRLITGPADAPASIVQSAGLEPQYQSILAWRPSGKGVPNPPERVASYAGDAQAYVTWKPSYAEGSSPVRSYTVRACVRGGSRRQACGRTVGEPVTVSAADFQRFGYVIVPGLTDGTPYRFTVMADNAEGASTPSLPSPSVTPEVVSAGLPGPPTSVSVRVNGDAVQLRWYAPDSDGGQPVLAYLVTSSTGEQYTVTGLRQLVVSFARGDAFQVFGGLVPGQTYSYSVSAVTPAGTGPAVTTPAITPTS